jgi:hypothetical protein
MRLVAFTTGATVGAFTGIAAWHVAWGLGASFPFRTRAEAAEAVIGSQRLPGLASSLAVAAALAGATALVADIVPLPAPVRRLGVVGVASVLTTRAAFGFAGATDRLVPGSNAPRFVRLDRRLYSPLCLALAAGSAASLTTSG